MFVAVLMTITIFVSTKNIKKWKNEIADIEEHNASIDRMKAESEKDFKEAELDMPELLKELLYYPLELAKRDKRYPSRGLLAARISRSIAVIGMISLLFL